MQFFVYVYSVFFKSIRNHNFRKYDSDLLRNVAITRDRTSENKSEQKINHSNLPITNQKSDYWLQFTNYILLSFLLKYLYQNRQVAIYH